MPPAVGHALHTLSTVQRLPPSIIYEILQYFSAPLLTKHLDRFPWHIAHICRSWRIEFTSMRRNFWNEISISLWKSNRKAVREHERTLDVLDMFLECNRGYPFSFKLEVHGSAVKSTYFSLIFDKIISESARWRRVTLSLVGIADISALDRAKGKLDHLESLNIYTVGDIDYAIPEAITDLFISAPYFTRTAIRPLSTWNFNWSTITVLCLRLVQSKEVARLPLILSQAMRLEMLSVDLSCESGASFPSHELITLPNLTTLDTNGLSLLQIMITPSLKQLQFVGSKSELHPTIVGVMMSKSQCRVQVLAIGHLNAALAIEILSHTPDIRVLCMAGIDDMSNVFGWLNEMYRVQTPKLTRLQSLTICNSWAPADRTDEFFDFVASRKTRIEVAGSIVEKLQKIDLGNYWDAGEEMDEVQARLRKLCDELYGIQFSVNGYPPEVERVHDRSSDPYIYSSFEGDEMFGEQSDEESDKESGGEEE